ncbi:MAG: DUF2235 domain-containing protein [Gammaproteobacteria bacterium]
MAQKIVICCDGAWHEPINKKDSEMIETNIEKLSKLIDPKKEVKLFYDTGMPTNGMMEKFKGQDLLQSIKDAYAFIVKNYTKESEIYLFGFSRGAYVVRSVAGMIRKCGILTEAGFEDQLDNAMKLYRNLQLDRNSMEAEMFRAKYTMMPKDTMKQMANGSHKMRIQHNIKIKFLGVFETVGALGIPTKGLTNLNNEKYQFHDTMLSPDVMSAYQALAIDETRSAMMPCVWKAPMHIKEQMIEQCWFAGTHANIGGNFSDEGLSNISLHWMLEKARKHGLPLLPAAKKVKGDPFAICQKFSGAMYRGTKIYERPLMNIEYANMMIHESVNKRFQEISLKYYPNNLLYEMRKKDPTLIIAKEQYNFTGKYLQAGKKYQFTADGMWQDKGSPADASGFQKFHLKPLRFKKGRTFTLVGTIGRDDTTAFDIGEMIENHATFTPEKSGMLFCFANDARSNYGNNTGFIKVGVRGAH